MRSDMWPGQHRARVCKYKAFRSFTHHWILTSYLVGLYAVPVLLHDLFRIGLIQLFCMRWYSDKYDRLLAGTARNKRCVLNVHFYWAEPYSFTCSNCPTMCWKWGYPSRAHFSWIIEFDVIDIEHTADNYHIIDCDVVLSRHNPILTNHSYESVHQYTIALIKPDQRGASRRTGSGWGCGQWDCHVCDIPGDGLSSLGLSISMDTNPVMYMRVHKWEVWTILMDVNSLDFMYVDKRRR